MKAVLMRNNLFLCIRMDDIEKRFNEAVDLIRKSNPKIGPYETVHLVRMKLNQEDKEKEQQRIRQERQKKKEERESKISLRDLIQRRKNLGPYADVYEVMSRAEKI